MSLSNDLKIRIDAEFNGEEKFKSAQASASALGRELDKLEKAERAMAAQESAAYAEQARMQAAATAATEEAASAQGDAMEKVGAAAAAVGVATVIGLGLAVKAATDWEAAWTGVTKTVDGSPAQMDALEESLRGLARTLPVTHEEIAGVAEAAGQLGVQRSSITAFTKTMVDLGQTTNLSAEDAATGLAQLMNVMGTAPADVGRLGSALVALGNQGASTEADILDTASYISGSAKLIGASESDVLALSNAMTSMGISSERGGGVMTRVMQDMYAAVQDGGDSLEGFAEVAGVSAADFAAKFRAEPISAIDDFVQGLNRIDSTGGNVITTLGDLGYKGTQDTAVLLQLKGAGDLLSDSLTLGNEAWQENSALTAEAAKRYETTEAKIATAKNQINDTAIAIGANLLPVLSSSQDFVGNLAAAFGGLSGGQQKLVATLGLSAGAIIGLTGAASIAIPKMVQFRLVLDGLAGGTSKLGRGLGAATSVLTGPWGLALIAATALLGVWIAKQGAAKRSIDALAGSLDQQTGAITEQARTLKIDQLVDQKVFAQADKLGISLKDITDAALGNEAAMRRVDAQIAAVYDASTRTEGAFDSMGGGLDATAEAAANLQTALHGSAQATDKAQELARQRGEAMGVSAVATDDAAASTDGLTTSMEDGQGGAQSLSDAIETLTNALDALNGGQLSANDASRAWEAAIDDASKALADNGKNLDATTEAGRENTAALDGMAKAAMDNAEAILNNGGTIEQFQGSLASARQSLFETASRFGLSEEAAWAYVDSVLAVPSKTATEVLLQGTALAKGQVSVLLDSLGRLPKSIQIPIIITGNRPMARGAGGGGGLTLADGGVVEYFADGGFSEPHVPQIVHMSGKRVFSEPETDGEAYIPLADSKRGASKAIVEDVVGRFGGDVQWLASGGISPGQLVSSSFMRSQLGITPGPVGGGRYAGALAGEATAAAAAADAEARLVAVREASRAQVDALKDSLDSEADALKTAQQAASDALKRRGDDELSALKRRGDDKAEAFKRRNADELTALKDAEASKDTIEATSRRQDDAEKALSRSQDDAEKAASRRQDEVEKAAAAAASQALDQAKAAGQARVDALQAAGDRDAATAEDALSAAKDRATTSTQELRDAEGQLAEARSKALELAQRTTDALARGASLGTAYDDKRIADVRAASSALEVSLAAADGAGRITRGESGASALERRTQALRDLAAAGADYASSQEALGTVPAAVQASLASTVERVRALGAAYGLAAGDVDALASSLTERPGGGDLLASMQAEAARTTELASLIRQLTAAGLSSSLVDDIVAGGTTAGLGQARSVLAGGPGLISGLNDASSRITSTAADLGSYVAGQRFDPTKPQQVALVAGAQVALARDTAVGLVSGTSVDIDQAAILDLSDRLEAAFRSAPIKVTVNGGGGGGGPLPPLAMAP